MSKQALPGTRLNMFGMDPDDVVIIGLDTDDGPDHPLWDERIKLPVDEALGLNMAHYGNIEPVIVRKNGSVPEVVDGRQRVRAARWVNEKVLIPRGETPLKLKVIAQTGEDDKISGVMISANEQRKDDDPLTKARKLQRFLELGNSDKDAALAFGVTTTTIRNWKKLLNLAPEVQEAVESGQLSASAAAEVSDLPREDQVKVIEEVKAKVQAEPGPAADAEKTARSAKLTTEVATQARRARTGSTAATKFIPPKMTQVRSAVVGREADIMAVAGTLDARQVLDLLKWFVGESDGSSVGDLVTVLTTKAEKAEQSKPVKLSKAQQDLLDMLDACGGEVKYGDVSERTFQSLEKLGLVEDFDHPCGLLYVRKTEAGKALADSVTPSLDPVVQPQDEGAQAGA